MMSTTLPEESGDDSDDEHILEWYRLNQQNKQNIGKRKQGKEWNPVNGKPLEVNDEILLFIRPYDHTKQPFKVIDVRNGLYLLRSALLPPRCIGSILWVTEAWLKGPGAQCTGWTYPKLPPPDPLRDCTLYNQATRSGVRIVQTKNRGYGIVATRVLCKGRLLPYGGTLTGVQREGGIYNCQIAPDIYMVVDRVGVRGIGSLANDGTVRVTPSGDVIPTHCPPNARLLFLEPYDGYVDDWAHGVCDGSEASLQVEILREVQEGEEISVEYGNEYWNTKRRR